MTTPTSSPGFCAATRKSIVCCAGTRSVALEVIPYASHNAIAAIVDLGRDRRGQLTEARRRLAATSATVLGFIGTGKADETAAYAPDRARLDESLEAIR